MELVLTKARSRFVAVLQRPEKKLTASFGSYKRFRLLFGAQALPVFIYFVVPPVSMLAVEVASVETGRKIRGKRCRGDP